MHAPLATSTLMHAEANGLQDIRTADWSNEVAPFWGEVVKSALTSEGIWGLLKAGWTTIKGNSQQPTGREQQHVTTSWQVV